jgi:hypothetical protein
MPVNVSKPVSLLCCSLVASIQQNLKALSVWNLDARYCTASSSLDSGSPPGIRNTARNPLVLYLEEEDAV